MAQESLRNPITAAVRAPFMKRGGQANSIADIDYAWDNATGHKWRNAGDTADVEVLNVDSDDTILLGGEAIVPQRKTVTINLGVTAAVADQSVWIADGSYTITGITEIHKTAGGTAASIYVEKLASGVASGDGTSVQSGTFDLNATANTLQTATLTTASPKPDGTSAVLDVVAGDRLGVVTDGTLGSVAGVQITITMTPAAKGHQATVALITTADILTSYVFHALRPMTVTGVRMSWDVAASDSGTVTVDLTHETTTGQAGSGSSILTAAQSVKGTANTPVTCALTATTARLSLIAGDRISMKVTGSTTDLAGLVISISFAPVYGRKEVTYAVPASALNTAFTFFTADRDYWVEDIGCVYDVASTNVYATVTHDTGTTAPGAGVAFHTDSTGFDTNATARTSYYGTMAANHLRWLAAGSRIGLKYTGTTIGSAASLLMTVSLYPR